jgi:hypothetical protein
VGRQPYTRRTAPNHLVDAIARPAFSAPSFPFPCLGIIAWWPACYLAASIADFPQGLNTYPPSLVARHPFVALKGKYPLWASLTRTRASNLPRTGRIASFRPHSYQVLSHHLLVLLVSLSRHILGFLGSLQITIPGALRRFPIRASAHSEESHQQILGIQTTMLLPFTVKVFEPSVWSPTYVSIMSSFSSLTWKEPCKSTIVHLSGSEHQALQPKLDQPRYSSLEYASIVSPALGRF